MKKAFVKKVDEQSRVFLPKPKQILDESPTTLRRLTMTGTAFGMIRITQSDKIGRSTEAHSEKNVAGQRALAQYIGVDCRLDVCAAV